MFRYHLSDMRCKEDIFSTTCSDTTSLHFGWPFTLYLILQNDLVLFQFIQPYLSRSTRCRFLLLDFQYMTTLIVTPLFCRCTSPTVGLLCYLNIYCTMRSAQAIKKVILIVLCTSLLNPFLINFNIFFKLLFYIILGAVHI